MDMKKIQNLLDGKIEDDDINENDLEDELEAILSGRPVGKLPSKPSKLQAVKPEWSSRPSKNYNNKLNRNTYKNVGSDIRFNGKINFFKFNLTYIFSNYLYNFRSNDGYFTD